MFTNEEIKNTIRIMKILGYDEVKRGMFSGVFLTGSWFRLEDLKKILTDKEYESLCEEIENKARNIYSRKNYPESSLKELEEDILNKINRTMFVIECNENNQYFLSEYFSRNAIVRPLDVINMDGEILANTVLDVMQRHLDCGVFYDNEHFTAEQLEKELGYNIISLKRKAAAFKVIKEESKKIEQTQPEEVENMKDTAIQAEQTSFDDLDMAIEYLQECRRQGKNVYIDFAGHILYSCDVTIDSAYMQVVGITKTEYYDIKKEYDESKTIEKRKAIVAKYNAIREKNQISMTPGEETSSKKI